MLWTEKTSEMEVSYDEDKNNEEGKIEEIDEEKEKGKKKKVKEVSHESNLVNKPKPIWMRKPEEITKYDSSDRKDGPMTRVTMISVRKKKKTTAETEEMIGFNIRIHPRHLLSLVKQRQNKKRSRA